MTKLVTPYNSSETKKTQVQNMFDNIAPKYDKLNRILSFGIDIYWRNTAIKYLSQYHPTHMIDIACGTGDFSFAAMKLKPKKIVGIDISGEMLAIGKKKIIEKSLEDTIEFIKGDSEDIQFGDNTFDAATVAFGVRNFENLLPGLKEIHRVMKSGAPFIVLEFSKPGIFPIKQLYNFYFKTICPLVGRLVSKDSRAYSYLYESVSVFPEGESFLKQLQNAGFKNTKCRRLSFGICSLYTAEK